ncbi:nucleoporin, partial [Moniliophthora roreri]
RLNDTILALSRNIAHHPNGLVKLLDLDQTRGIRYETGNRTQRTTGAGTEFDEILSQAWAVTHHFELLPSDRSREGGRRYRTLECICDIQRQAASFTFD